MKKDFMAKSAASFAIFLAACVLMTGCAELKDKFVRKPKKEEKKGRYYAVRKYDVKPNLDLYTKRYIYWKNWHRELLDVLTDSNQKKKKVAIEQEISNLIDMQRMLIDSKAEGLGKIIDKMSKIEVVIKKEGVSGANETKIRRQLENLGKETKRDYSYRKIGGCLRESFAPRGDYTT